jgi:type VI secretion system protein ImpA
MPFREDILNPIPGDNPGGADLRYDPVYDKIKEARREDDDLNQGDWKHERKLADWLLVAKLCEEQLATRSKDLQLASWLVEAAVRKRGINGLLEGLSLVQSLVGDYWDHLYPGLEDGDAEFRATPLDWLANQLIQLARGMELNKEGHSYLRYKESREVGYEAAASSDAAKKLRNTKLNEGKLAPELFDTAFGETTKAYYVALDANLAKAFEATKALVALCDEKFGDYSPSFSKFIQALEEVRQVSKSLLDKKREIEPDPIPEEAPEEGEEQAAEGEPGAEGTTTGTVSAGPSVSIGSFSGAEQGARKEIIESLVQSAAALRRMDPTNPGPYLLLRGFRFGELRAAANRGEILSLEAPPTELRRQLRVYALGQKWKELVELAEASLALPSSRAWLDLHRLTAEALNGLGGDYANVAIAIRAELRAVVNDIPAIRTAVLMDDTPACNAQTLAWLDEIEANPSEEMAILPAETSVTTKPAWSKRPADPFSVAVDALRKGDKAKALEIMRNEIEAQPSNRGKFLRQMQVAELCIQAGSKEIAQPFLEDVKLKLKEFRVPEWEDRGIVVQALADLYLYHDETVSNGGERTKVFQQICRIDPVRALGLRS